MAPFERLQGVPWQHGKVSALTEGTADVIGHGDSTTVAAAKEGGSE